VRTTFLIAALLTAAPVLAFEVDVGELRAAATDVTATVALRDALPDRFRRIVDDGGVVLLRVQAEVWERRPVWDRLVYPAAVRVFRLSRAPGRRDVAITDATGHTALHPEMPDPLELSIRIGSADRLRTAARYYAKVVATLGTIAEREIEDAAAAVFGRADEQTGLSALGRTIFAGILQISDYLQSVSAEAVSRHVEGAQILRP
jgi:hypothetical protein